MLNHILNGLSAVGNALDLPGSSVRDALSWKNPFDQWTTPLHDNNRTTGRDLLRSYGMAGTHNTWGNFAGGLAAEVLTDPTNLIPGKALMNASRARRAASEANVGIRASNAKSLLQRSQGFMPEEIAKRTVVKGDGGLPKRMFHGTPHVFEQFSTNHLNENSIYGKGIYTTENPHIAGGEAGYWLKDAAPDAPSNVRMQYLDVRNPFDMDAIHPVAGMRSVEGKPSFATELANDALTSRQDARWEARLMRESPRRDPVEMEHLKNLFDSRNVPENVTGQRYADYLKTVTGTPDGIRAELKKAGYDGVTHIGGGRKGQGLVKHKVAIAFDPSQVYKPYIAREIQPAIRLPSLAPVSRGLAGYNALARRLPRGGSLPARNLVVQDE